MQAPRVSAPVSSPALGDVVLGCFRLTKTLGAGSFATAYLAEQLGTDRLAVVKLPHAYLLAGPNGPELRRRFEAEARASTRIVHPNLVTVFLSGDTRYGVPALAMEYVPGESLGARLTRGGPLSPDALAAIGEQLADVLATLHGAGVVHRDLSPSNVLVQSRTNGVPWTKVLDLGVAKLLDAPSRTLGPMGTPGYVAPEQLLGEVSPRTDVYSLGALLWWALTGSERPDDFHDGSLRRKIGSTEAPDPRALRPDAPAAYAELVGCALIPEPSARPSATEFLEAWRAVGLTRISTASLGPSAPVPSPPQTLDADRPTVAVTLSNPVLRAQVLQYLEADGRARVEQLDARELGRAEPGRFAAAVLGEQLPEVGTAAVVQHLDASYPELPIIVVGHDGARRSEWLVAGAEAFIELPAELPDLGLWLEGTRQTSIARADVDETSAGPKLRPSLVETLRRRDPHQFAGALEAFIGCVPQWIAEIERGLDEPGGDGSRPCQQLSAAAEAVGAEGLGRLAEAACQSLHRDDPDTARTFLATAEREYREVFREAFTLMNELQTLASHQ